MNSTWQVSGNGGMTYAGSMYMGPNDTVIGTALHDAKPYEPVTILMHDDMRCAHIQTNNYKEVNKTKKMETKSRYAMISELEEKKDSLIRERDSLVEDANRYDQVVLKSQRALEDLSKKETEFKMDMNDKLQNLDREKVVFEFKISNTRIAVDRETADAEVNAKTFRDSIEAKKTTINELIKGVDSSLERFNKLQLSK